MKNNKIRDAWNEVAPDQAADERMRKAILLQNTSSRRSRRFILPMVISLALVAIIALPFLRKEDPSIPWPISSQGIVESGKSEPTELTFDLVKSSPSIQINYVAEPQGVQYQASLVYLSEEELLADSYEGNQLAAFHGTVKAIHNLEIIFKHRSEEFSVVEMEIIEDFRTALEAGTVVTVRMPGHIYDGGGSNTVMDTAGTLKVGSEAIMMPFRYDETSFYTETGGETVYKYEISQYGIGDGIRWLFVETPDGLAFADHAYPSFLQAETLEDVAEIIRNY